MPCKPANAQALKSPLGTFTAAPNTSRAEYEANFVVSGAHYVWIRHRAFDSGSDSAYVEVDNLGTQSMWLGGQNGSWAWSLAGPYILTPGPHTVKVYRREPNLEVDKVLLTTDPGYVPTGTGPPESPTQ